MTEQRDTRRPEAAQDGLTLSLQEELALEQSRALTAEELEAIAGGPLINNGP